MQVEVLHKIDSDFCAGTDGRYELAAIVIVSEFDTVEAIADEVFHLTNHIDTPWHLWPRVIRWWAPGRPGPRSTSVGDLVVIDQFHVIEYDMFGFQYRQWLHPVTPRKKKG